MNTSTQSVFRGLLAPLSEISEYPLEQPVIEGVSIEAELQDSRDYHSRPAQAAVFSMLAALNDEVLGFRIHVPTGFTSFDGKPAAARRVRLADGLARRKLLG